MTCCFFCDGPCNLELKLPSASALDRGINCPASQALPHIKSQPGTHAKLGTAVHAFLDNCTKVGREKALELVPPEYKQVCELLDLTLLPTDAGMFASEVGLAWDYITGKARVLPSGSLEHSETEILGIGDVLAQSQTAVYYGDYKTGFGYVAPAKKNHQLRFIAMAAAKAYGKSSAVVEAIFIREDQETGSPPYRDRAELDAFDLDETADTMQRMIKQIHSATQTVLEGRRPNVKEGPWCKYCPAYEHCPAKRDLLAAVIGSGAAALAGDDLVQSYFKSRELVQLGKRAMDKLKEHAQRSPLDLGNGMIYGPTASGIVREHRKVS